MAKYVVERVFTKSVVTKSVVKQVIGNALEMCHGAECHK